MALDFVKPSTVQESINRVTYHWEDYTLKVIADRLSDAGGAELWFYNSNGHGDSLLHTAKVNLLSTTTMGQIAKRMKEHSPDVPWTQVLTFVTSRSMEYQRRGEPGAIIKPIPDTIKHPGYYIDPIILKGLPNVIHGMKGANKTTLCLTMLGIIACGVDDGPTGLISSVKQARVGILDWENDLDTTTYNIACLVQGGTIPYFEPAYMRCSATLIDDIDRIAHFVSDNKLEVVLIDSLGSAAGSDQFDSSGKRAALKFYEALRPLKVTTLTIGQEAKNEEGKKSIYGSVYYQYYSRNIFELKATKDKIDQNVLHLGLFHTDANFSGLHEPMGFRTTYQPGSVSIESEPVKFSQFLEKASQTNELVNFLGDGPKSVAAIAEELEVSDNQARQVISRVKKKGLIKNMGTGMYGLATDREEGY